MNKRGVIIGLIVGLALLLYLFRGRIAGFFKKKLAAPKSDVSPADFVAPEIVRIVNDKFSAPAAQGLNYDKVLQRGDNSPETLWLQKGLNHFYKAGLSEDGKFGPKTEAALKKVANVARISLKQAVELAKIDGKI